MVSNKDRYKKYAYCSTCDIEVPSIRTVFEEYGYTVAVKQPWDYPRVYDDKGNMYYLQTLMPIRQINRRGRDGTLFEEIREFTVKVFCPECNRQCRSKPYSKTPAKNNYKKSGEPVGRPRGPDKEKETVDYWVEIIDERKDSIFGETLEDVPSHLRSKVKRGIDKKNEGKESSSVT